VIHSLYSRRGYLSILDAISPEVEQDDSHDDVDSMETASVIISSNGRPPSAMTGIRPLRYEYYRDRLSPLVELEDRLTRLLSSPDEEEATHLALTWHQAEFPLVMGSNGKPAPTITIPDAPKSQSSPVTPVAGVSKAKKEVSVHTTTNWKKAFALGSRSKSPKSAHSGEIEGWWEDPDDPVHALNACAVPMMELWRDETVRHKLVEKRLRLEESSGLYVFRSVCALKLTRIFLSQLFG